MILFKKCAVAFFFLFFLHGTSIGNGQQGISYNSFIYAKTAPPQMISYQINVIPKWLIKNEPNYFVDDKNKVYNLKTGKALQMQLKGYTKGYYLSGCFYSLNKLIPLLIKIKTEKIPF